MTKTNLKARVGLTSLEPEYTPEDTRRSPAPSVGLIKLVLIWPTASSQGNISMMAKSIESPKRGFVGLALAVTRQELSSHNLSARMNWHSASCFAYQIYDATHCTTSPTVNLKLPKLPRRANHNGYEQCRSSCSPSAPYVQLPNRVRPSAWRHDEYATSPQLHESGKGCSYRRKELHHM